jgi:hypothetical protein
VSNLSQGESNQQIKKATSTRQPSLGITHHNRAPASQHQAACTAQHRASSRSTSRQPSRGINKSPYHAWLTLRSYEGANLLSASGAAQTCNMNGSATHQGGSAHHALDVFAVDLPHDHVRSSDVTHLVSRDHVRESVLDLQFDILVEEPVGLDNALHRP